MKCNFSKLRDGIKTDNGAEVFLAALFSLAAAAFAIWLIKPYFYNRVPVYEELVAGGTVWDGYFKQGDLYVFYLMLFLIPLFFCLFLLALHKAVPRGRGFRKAKGSAISDKEEGGRRQSGHLSYGKYFMAFFVYETSLLALRNTAAAFLPGHREELQWAVWAAAVFLPVAFLGISVWFLVKKKDIDSLAGKLLLFSQLIPALGLPGYYRFYYEYEGAGDRIPLYYSPKWKLFCMAAFLVFFLWQLIQVLKKKPGIYLSTLMIAAINSVAAVPEGILSVDFFHNGEMSFPMQQLLSYGRMPYFDLDPIHGFCDFFYSALNRVFFDGTYMSQSAAVMAAELFMAAFLAFVMGKCIRNRYAVLITVCLLMPYLVQKAGVRYLVFFAAFFILLSVRVREDSRRYLWWWVLLCILGISWNVSIGSAMAVAFLPEVLYRTVKDIIPGLKNFKNWNPSEKKKFAISYGILFLTGIAYIPLFLQILRFLGENAGTTLYVNGTPIFGEDFHFIRTFGIALPYLLAFIYALKGSRRERSAFVSMLFCLAVIGNYACVRYDEGARLAVLAVFFGMLFILTAAEGKGDFTGKGISQKRDEICFLRTGSVLCGVLILYLAWEYLPVNNENSMFPQKIEGELEITVMDEKVKDPVVYVSGDSVGLPALGTGFIQGSTLNSLKNIRTVMEAEIEGQSYLDLTNKISHYVIFDKESFLPFTSAYNISNGKMQERAMSFLDEERPELVLAAPLIRFDLAPVSLRSMQLYTALIRMGYKPYVYGDVVYLKDGEALLEGAVDGKRSLGLICHKEYLGMLPFIWGNSVNGAGADISMEMMDVPYECIGEEEVAALKIETDALDGTDISYVGIKVKRDKIKKEQWEFSFYSDVDSESHSFGILSGTDKETEEYITYLVPVGSSPFWQFSRINNFCLEGIEEVEEIRFYR